MFFKSSFSRVISNIFRRSAKFVLLKKKKKKKTKKLLKEQQRIGLSKSTKETSHYGVKESDEHNAEKV